MKAMIYSKVSINNSSKIKRKIARISSPNTLSLRKTRNLRIQIPLSNSILLTIQ